MEPSRTPRGFTLLETMVVLVITALLVSLAVPAWRQYVLRAHRAEAIGALMRIAACQERTRAARGRYDDATCLPPSDEHYRYSYEEAGETNGSAFIARAEPLRAQAADTCGTLTLGHDGARRAHGPTADGSACWSAR